MVSGLQGTGGSTYTPSLINGSPFLGIMSAAGES
jgi:hypothetical protein